MSDRTYRLGPVMFVISLLGSVLLISMGVVFAFNHSLAADAYGVTLSGGPDNSWISSAAWRDVAFGLLAFTFAVLRDRRAMGLSLLFGSLIPIGDAIVVIRNSSTPLLYLPLHVGGAIACLLLAVVLLLGQKKIGK